MQKQPAVEFSGQVSQIAFFFPARIDTWVGSAAHEQRSKGGKKIDGKKCRVVGEHMTVTWNLSDGHGGQVNVLLVYVCEFWPWPVIILTAKSYDLIARSL